MPPNLNVLNRCWMAYLLLVTHVVLTSSSPISKQRANEKTKKLCGSEFSDRLEKVCALYKGTWLNPSSISTERLEGKYCTSVHRRPSWLIDCSRIVHFNLVSFYFFFNFISIGRKRFERAGWSWKNGTPTFSHEERMLSDRLHSGRFGKLLRSHQESNVSDSYTAWVTFAISATV